jgi:tetratricopeptide (TPR) repeat protein
MVQTNCRKFACILAVFLWLSAPVLFAQFGPVLNPKRAPQARSQEELDAYLEILAAKSPREALARMDAFIKGYPRSELLGTAYQYEMRAYEQLDDFDGMLRAGQHALISNPDNLSTLAALAPAMATRAAQRPDRVQLLAKAEEYAQRMLHLANTIQIPRKISLERWESEKRGIEKTAHQVLGTVALQRGKSTIAIEEFEKEISLTSQPDGAQYLRLGLAYTGAGKKEESQKALERAAELGPAAVRDLALSTLKKSSPEK